MLLVDGEPFYDSTSILHRLVEIAPLLLPSDARLRAETWLWQDLADRSLRNFVVAARWADPKNWPSVCDAYFRKAPWFVRKIVAPIVRRKVLGSLVASDVTRAGLPALWDEYRRTLDALEARAPDDGFWLGDAPCVADAAIYGHLHSLRIDALTPAQAREIKLRPALTDYLDRVAAAPKARSHLAAARG